MVNHVSLHKYSLIGIFDQVRQNLQKIYARENLENVFPGRKFRFITPEGKYDYTTFGNFYFPSPDTMMLITKDRAYTKYHKNDQMANTMWSTVPVIYAGISTGYKDDTGREIFTGDVVTAKNKEVTSIVRYLEHAKCPSLVGDNCDLMFSMCDEGLHVEGTAFCDMTAEMFDFYPINNAFWVTTQYYGIMSRQDVIDKASKALVQPHFVEQLQINKGNAVCYSSLAEAMSGDFKFVMMRGEDCEDENGEQVFELFVDDFPEDYDGACLHIKVVDHYDPIVQVKQPLVEFMNYAHRHPKTKFILCDFSKSLQLTKAQKEDLAMLLYPLNEYNIINVIVPNWIMLHWVTKDTILYGQD